MNENVKTCPLCPRGCDLSSPHCERGANFAQTGQLPQDQGFGGHGHDHGHRHFPPGLKFEKPEQQLVMKYLHHAVGVADHGGFAQSHAEEMFSVLSDEETAKLAELLEKLSEHWIQLAPNKPAHHGRP